MKALTKYIIQIKDKKEARDFIKSLFTSDEVIEFETRIKIIQLLLKGMSQREVAKKLNVGIATVSRGSNEIKKGHFKFLQENNEN